MCDVSEGEILIINTGSQCNGQRNVWWQKCAAVFWEAFRFWQKLCKNKIMMCNLSFFGDSLNNTTQRRSRKERKLGEKINFVELFGQFVQIIMILWAGSGENIVIKEKLWYLCCPLSVRVMRCKNRSENKSSFSDIMNMYEWKSVVNVQYVFLQLTFNFSLIQDNAAKCYFWQLFVILSKPTLIWSSWHRNICIVAIVCGHHLEICRDWSAKLGEHLSQKLPLPPTYNPKMWPKLWPGGEKICHFLSYGWFNL